MELAGILYSLLLRCMAYLTKDILKEINKESLSSSRKLHGGSTEIPRSSRKLREAVQRFLGSCTELSFHFLLESKMIYMVLSLLVQKLEEFPWFCMTNVKTQGLLREDWTSTICCSLSMVLPKNGAP